MTKSQQVEVGERSFQRGSPPIVLYFAYCSVLHKNNGTIQVVDFKGFFAYCSIVLLFCGNKQEFLFLRSHDPISKWGNMYSSF